MVKQFIIAFLMFSVSCFGQEGNRGTIKVKKVETEKTDTTRSELIISPLYKSSNVNTPPMFVEQMPAYPGGEKAMNDFIKKNLKYPEAEKKAGIQGTVYVTFVVGWDGIISNVKVLKGIADGTDCNQEAIRVVSVMPKWIAGKQNGWNVDVQSNLKIQFKL